jgi:uncharacterized membrane protein
MSMETPELSTDAPGAVASPTLPPSSRIDSVDLLRGLVMVLMVLDHTRDFFGDPRLEPTDLSKATAALFLTRWVTHFCAPVFAFLAGTGAYLAGARGRSRSSLSAFLATRGLWLIFLELTVMTFGLYFNPAPSMVFLLVLWSIGGSFVLLSGLVDLPSRWIGALGVVLIATHNLIDFFDFSPGAIGPLEPLAGLLLRPGLLPVYGGFSVRVGYPLLPWFGVVAAGYGFGELIRLEPARRRSIMLVTGLGLTALFVALRASGVYGDPNPWTTERTPLLTALSFLNCTKQPPSLLFVLMTLGPAIFALGLFDRVGARGPVGGAVVTLGRVPLFFFVLHFYLIHALAMLAGIARGLPVGWLCSNVFLSNPPPGWPLSLPGIYAVWAVVVVLMYIPCRWFAGVKRRHPGGWLAYL